VSGRPVSAAVPGAGLTQVNPLPLDVGQVATGRRSAGGTERPGTEAMHPAGVL
jgi:hypothetical protein